MFRRDRKRGIGEDHHRGGSALPNGGYDTEADRLQHPRNNGEGNRRVALPIDLEIKVPSGGRVCKCNHPAFIEDQDGIAHVFDDQLESVLRGLRSPSPVFEIADHH
jgi:hypothetical protein